MVSQRVGARRVDQSSDQPDMISQEWGTQVGSVVRSARHDLTRVGHAGLIVRGARHGLAKSRARQAPCNYEDYYYCAAVFGVLLFCLLL